MPTCYCMYNTKKKNKENLFKVEILINLGICSRVIDSIQRRRNI